MERFTQPTGEMDVEHLRRIASETPASASSGWRLAKGLPSSKNGEKDIEHLHKTVSETLASVRKNRRLAKALSPSKGDEWRPSLAI